MKGWGDLFKKICPYCSEDSYSASGTGNWICPYCSKNITDVRFETAGAKKLCAVCDREAVEDRESKSNKV